MSEGSPPSDAERLFDEHLARLARGEEVDFEALCAAHPEQADGLRRLARDRGFHTLFDDALDKVRDGVTTLDELLRVIPFRQVHVACREWTKRSVGG